MVNTVNLVIPLLEALGQEDAEVALNDTLEFLDVYGHGLILDQLQGPPGSPVEGDTYIVNHLFPTGDWSSFTKEDLAIWHNGAWINRTPIEGWIFLVEDEDLTYGFTGSVWEILSLGDQQTTWTLTDNTGGTSSNTIGDVGASYSQSTLNDIIASFASDIEQFRVALQAGNVIT